MANGLFGGGDGTELNPYLVEDAHDFNAIRNFPTSHFKQSAIIDMSPYSNIWEAIGDIDYFSGSYDGNNLDIINFRCVSENTASLFSYTENATFKNINVVNAYCESEYVAAILVYETNGITTLENCHATGISKSINSNWATCGLMGDSYAEILTVKNCSFKGEVLSDKGAACGFVGDFGGDLAIFENCHVIADITGGEYGAHLFGFKFYGGVKLNKVYTIGKLSLTPGEYNLAYVNGFIDYGDTIEINDCYVQLEIDQSVYNVITDTLNIHAFCSDLYYSQMNNCYVVVDSLGHLPIEIISYPDDSVINGVYYDKTLNPLESVESALFIGKSTTEMMQQVTFENWDFENVWRIDEGNDYPRFMWEPVKCVAFPLSTLKVNIIN